MEFKIKKSLQITLPLAIGFGLVWYSLRNIKPEEFIGYFLEADYTWIALGLFFGILSHLSRAYRWKFMLEPLGFNPKYANSVMAVLIAYLVNLTIPRAGEASRAAVMSNYEGIPFHAQQIKYNRRTGISGLDHRTWEGRGGGGWAGGRGGWGWGGIPRNP